MVVFFESFCFQYSMYTCIQYAHCIIYDNLKKKKFGNIKSETVPIKHKHIFIFLNAIVI